MRTRLKELLRRRRCEIMLVSLVPIAIFLIVISMEYAAALGEYDYTLDQIQRAVNTVVEYNIRDEYRADGVLPDTDAAEQALRSYIESGIVTNGRCAIHIDSVTSYASLPAMTVTGTVSFPTLLSRFRGDLEFSFAVTSINEE